MWFISLHYNTIDYVRQNQRYSISLGRMGRVYDDCLYFAALQNSLWKSEQILLGT